MDSAELYFITELFIIHCCTALYVYLSVLYLVYCTRIFIKVMYRIVHHVYVHTVQYLTALYSSVQYFIQLCFNVLCCTTLHCTVLTELFCNSLYWVRCAVLYFTSLYCTVNEHL
jgi:hypothetical protein